MRVNNAWIEALTRKYLQSFSSYLCDFLVHLSDFSTTILNKQDFVKWAQVRNWAQLIPIQIGTRRLPLIYFFPSLLNNLHIFLFGWEQVQYYVIEEHVNNLRLVWVICKFMKPRNFSLPDLSGPLSFVYYIQLCHLFPASFKKASLKHFN